MTTVRVSTAVRNKAIDITKLFSPVTIAFALAQILRPLADAKLSAKKKADLRKAIKIAKDAIGIAEEVLGPVE